MAKVGRKPWSPDLERIEYLASRGLSVEQIANSIGISRSTLFEKMRQYPELKDTIKRGSSAGLEQIGNKLFEAAVGGNVTAMIFFLKCRGGWKEGEAPSFSDDPLLNFFDS